MSLALLFLIIRHVDLRAVGTLLAKADPTLFGVALVLAILDRAIMIGKWHHLLRVLVPGVSAYRAARAYLGAGLASQLLPSSVGGDVIRAVAVGRGRESMLDVGATIIVERVLGMIGLSALALMAVGLAHGAGIELVRIFPWVMASMALFAVALAILAFSCSERLLRFLPGRAGAFIADSLRHFLRAVLEYRHHRRLLLGVGVVSFLEQLVPVAVWWTLAAALGHPISLMVLLVVVPLSMTAERLPISLNGWGVSEAGAIYLLGFFGVPPAVALGVTLLGRVVVLISLLPGVTLWKDFGTVRVPSPRVLAREAPNRSGR